MYGVPLIKDWTTITGSITHYVDNMLCGVAAGTNWRFTNGSNAVQCQDGNGNAGGDIQIGDYVKLEGDGATVWETVQSIADANNFTLSSNYTGGGGDGNCRFTANDGSSQADAWVHLESAITDATNNRIVAVRRNQTHTGTGDTTLGGNGDIGAPIIFIGDQDSLDIWADAGDVRPIYDSTSSEHTILIEYDYVLFANMHFKGDDNEYVLRCKRAIAHLYNCKAEDACLYYYYDANWQLDECDLDISGTTRACIEGYCSVLARNCTFDGGDYNVFQVRHGFFENCEFGADTQASVADIRVEAPANLMCRNCTFNGATEIVNAAASYNYDGLQTYAAVEDHDSTKAAWELDQVHSRNESQAVLSSFTAAGTGAGQRAGGATTVVKAVVGEDLFEAYAAMIYEVPINVDVATCDVNVWTQLSGWSVVADTQGADADLWVEVAAWDVATGGYLYFDSRDKGLQDAQANNAWNKIVVENVVVDVAGTIIVRVFCKTGDGADIVYVDRIVEVA
jgi:hypothetical protein